MSGVLYPGQAVTYNNMSTVGFPEDPLFTRVATLSTDTEKPEEG
jgi:hypothetical protein